MDENKIYEILMFYGFTPQTVKAIEEFSELQAEIAKYLNGQGEYEAIKSEMADAYIMFLQLMAIFDIDPEELDKEVDYKLTRQIQRIEKARKEGTDCSWQEGQDERD